MKKRISNLFSSIHARTHMLHIFICILCIQSSTYLYGNGLIEKVDDIFSFTTQDNFPKTKKIIQTNLRKQITLTLYMPNKTAPSSRMILLLLPQFHKQHPNIHIKPVFIQEYSQLNASFFQYILQLIQTDKTIIDMMLIPAYMHLLEESQYYLRVYLQEIQQLNITQKYEPIFYNAWNYNKLQYAIPLFGTSNVLFYNPNIFKKLDLNIPQTWEELIEIAYYIRDYSEFEPFSNTIHTIEDATTRISLAILPNFIDGVAGKIAYENGNRPLDDANMLNFFNALFELKKLLPINYKINDNTHALSEFMHGNVAMYFGSTLDIDKLLLYSTVDFDIFAIPAPANKSRQYMILHPVIGIGANNISNNAAQVHTFFQWLTYQNTAQFMTNIIANYIPLQIVSTQSTIKPINTLLSLINQHEYDVFFPYPKFMEKSPTAYTLLQDLTEQLLYAQAAPEYAIKIWKTNLEQWYLPLYQNPLS